MSHFVRRELEKLFSGLNRSEVEYYRIPCRVSSSVAVLFVDVYLAYHLFYILVLISVVSDKLHDLADNLDVTVFFRGRKNSVEMYLAADGYAIA